VRKLAASLLARWRRRRAAKHISGWDIPTFDENTGDLTSVRDSLAAVVEATRLKKARHLP
jgi:hypothetical protein